MADPYNIFQGNDVFLSGGQPVMPNNAIAAKLQGGNYGPFPNQSAPPGYVLPQVMDPAKIATALRSNILPNIGGAKPPGAGAAPSSAPAADPFANSFSPEIARMLAQGYLQQGFGPGGNGAYGGYGPGPGSSGADLGAAGLMGY